MMQITFSDVKERATGGWVPILGALAPAVSQSLAQHPRHVACPIHGGRDGFRLFTDVRDSGGGICNTCGSFPDGFSLLSWINGWSLRETLLKVADHLGMSGSGEIHHHQNSLPPVQQQTTQPPLISGTWQKIQSTLERTILLTMPEAEPARRYLRQRGLKDI